MKRLAVIRHATGIQFTWFHNAPRQIRNFGWVPDATHLLGGSEKTLTLYRRVNLKKDDLPRWITGRPLYEYTREVPGR